MLTPEQRSKVCLIIQNACIFQYADLKSTNEGGHYSEYWVDAYIRLPFPGGEIKLQISDNELVKAIETIDGAMLLRRDEIQELHEEITSEDEMTNESNKKAVQVISQDVQKIC